MTDIDVVDGDKLRLNCSVSYADYFGYLTPVYDWTVLTSDDDGRRIAQESAGGAYLTASWPAVPPLRCSVYFDGSGESSYSDAASNAPVYRGECTTDAVQVLSPPRDLRLDDSTMSGGRQLRCSAVGRPTPTYEWYGVSDAGGDDERPFAVGDLLILNGSGRHQVRCTAVNVIRGVRHTLASEPVTVDVLPLPRRRDIPVSTDSGLGIERNYSRSSVRSVQETVTQSSTGSVGRDSGVLGRLIDSPYFVPGTCVVAVVALFTAVAVIVSVVVLCRRRTKQRQLRMSGIETVELASAVTTSSNERQESGNGAQPQRSDGRIVDDDEHSSAVYDEIGSTTEFTRPLPAAPEQYEGLVAADVGSAVASGTSGDVYRPLQRDIDNKLTKITIAVGKCDVNIVLSGDGVTGTTSLIHAASSASLQYSRQKN